MSVPFEKFTTRLGWGEWSKFIIKTFPPVHEATKEDDERDILADQRRRFIEDAIREKIERERT